MPKIKMNKKEAVVEESAERDKILKDMGVNFTKEYFMKRYNLTEERSVTAKPSQAK